MSKNERKEKAEAYAQHYLAMFRRDVLKKEHELSMARARLEIAEREYAAGEMVTGQPDCTPAILRGVLKA